jgi:hypothetical protein
MSRMQERFNFAMELQNLRKSVDKLEAQLKKQSDCDLNDPIRTFQVVLNVETRSSSWGEGYVDSAEMTEHFRAFIPELRNVLHLDEEYESIKVQQVTEVT